MRPATIDSLLASVNPRHELTIDAWECSEGIIARIVDSATARGLHASGARGWILVRDMRIMFRSE